ncbi:MAG: hypothetical protein ACI9JD_001808, partial [Rhodococcus sp. (in: high G+C Gram-positive bacteria)]
NTYPIEVFDESHREAETSPGISRTDRFTRATDNSLA